MKSEEIRKRFLSFFEKRGHTIIPSASLVTSDEKEITNPTLFNTAGMQPLIPYILGKPFMIDGKEVKRLVDVQKCLRTVDIDEVGDKVHATFFEMLGNWSLGDYFKKEAINWSYEFLTDGKEGLGLNPNQLYITVFDGSTGSPQDVGQNAPRDDEAAEIWREIFAKNEVEGERIFYMPAHNNWWEAGDNGPCGPDTEMYYDIKNKFGGRGITKEEFIRADDARDIVEIWNDVFMQYEKKDGKIIGKLLNPSVDTGAGLERLAMTLQGVDNIYDTDLLKPVIRSIQGDVEFEIDLTISKDEHKRVFEAKKRSEHIVADHIKASVMMIADGVTPSNTDRGYVLRKLIRRAVRHSDLLFRVNLPEVVKAVQDQYKAIYPNVIGQDDGLTIQKIIRDEEKKFRETLKLGLKEFEKGVDAFTLFSSYGFPLELTLELAKEKGVTVDVKDFEEKFKKHQELSRMGAEKKFKGGLADTSDKVIQYHTATHLLHQALHDVLGEEANQKGSNITAERLRFDFTHSVKMTQEEIKRVEEIVNEKIKEASPVRHVVMPRDKAEKTGARHFFGEKYGDQISIYYIGDSLENAYSKEFCGGPHVKNTKELSGSNDDWKFKIIKEEAVASGIRRIKAVLI